MDLQVLKAFELTAELGSLSRASAAMGVAQSALSRQLSSLEAEVGSRLFHRTGRGMALTEAGAAMRPRAVALLADAQSMVDAVSEVMSSPRGVVSVGLVPAWSHSLVGRLVAWQREQHPGIQLRIHEGYSGEIEEWLANGRIDVGIFNRYRAVGRGDVVLTTSMHVIARADDQAISSSIKLRDLAALPLALMTRPNALRMLLEEHCNRNRVALNVALEADSGPAIKSAVLGGGLYSVLPLHGIAAERQMGLLRGIPISAPAVRQSTLLETTVSHPLTAAAKVVWKALPHLLRTASHPSE